jgi:hypothetical protein
MLINRIDVHAIEKTLANPPVILLKRCIWRSFTSGHTTSEKNNHPQQHDLPRPNAAVHVLALPRYPDSSTRRRTLRTVQTSQSPNQSPQSSNPVIAARMRKNMKNEKRT